MAVKKIDDTILTGIADSIREKLSVQTQYKPSEMADAIDTIESGYPEPTGTKTITANGTGIDVKDYASADVAVPNSYTAEDEGKVVDNGALVPQTSRTVTDNGTYDTTTNDEVVVNVSGGEPTYAAYHVWTKSTSGSDASLWVQEGTYTGGVFTATGEQASILFNGSTYTEHQIGDLFTIASYVDNSYNWAATADSDVISDDVSYADGERIKKWYYNVSVDFYVISANGGGGSYPVTDAIYDEDITGYTVYAKHAVSALSPASQTIASAISDYFTGKLVDLSGTASGSDMTIELTKVMAQMTASAFEQAGYFDAKGAEYSGYVYGASMISELGLVLLGDFSNTGAATGNTLSDSINNYSGVILQGIYKTQKTSSYNTSCLYQNIVTGTAYWAGMKDRNSSYGCNVTFTDDTTVSLTGNKQVLIYGIL